MKKLLLVTMAAALLLISGALLVLGSPQRDPVYTIESEVILPADAERSWQALTSFEAYPEWNPYVTRADGDFEPGAILRFTIVDDNFVDSLDLHSELGDINPPEHFYWTGVVGLRGLHDTKHGFSLQPLKEGTTRLRHYEEFRGILPMLLPNRDERIAKTRASFNRMNQALRARLKR